MARIRKSQKNSIVVGATQKIMWRIGIYIRLSKEDNDKEKDESNSVTNQRKIDMEFIDTRFENDDHIIVDEFIDDGLTGTDDSRANFQRLLGNIENRTINCIVTKNLSRAFRNHADQGYYLEQYFPERSIRFITVSDNIKIDTFENPEIVHSFEVPITGVMNDRYAYKTSMDVRATFRAKRARGEFIGAFAPYGYRKDPMNKNHLLIDPDAEEIVLIIFVWLTQDGMSIHGIARRLTEQGIPNPTEYKHSKGFNYKSPHSEENDGRWNPKTVRDILKNKVYIGTMVQGQQRVISYKAHKSIRPPEDEWFVVPDMHDPIVTNEMFEAAQRLLEKDVRVAPKQKEPHILAGLVKCADCHKGLHRKESKGYAYLSCRTYMEKSRTACTKHSIREDKLQQAVLLAIQRQIDLIASIADLIEAINKTPKSQGESKRLALLLKQRNAELVKETNIVDSLYADWKNGDISREEYLRLKEQHMKNSDELKERIQNITDEMEALTKGVQSNEPFFQSFLKHRNITRLERGLLVELVDTIYVHEDGSIQIDFNFSDQYQRALDFIEVNSREKTTLTLVKSIG